MESTDFVGALTALGLYLDAAERLARSRTATPKLREALTAAKQELQTVVRLHMARRGAADS